MRTKTLTKFKSQVLTLVLTIVALVAGHITAAAVSTFTVSNIANKFTVTRSETTTAESVRYRTVSLSALAGKHFTANVGVLDFAVGESSKIITVAETDVKNIPSPYCYQDGNTRTYRFEVYNDGGKRFCYCDRTLTYSDSYKISQSPFNKQKLAVITTDTKVTDKGFKQGYHAVPLANFFNATAPQAYFKETNVELRMTVSMKVWEEDDGYQYIQIVANNHVEYDNENDNGDPGTPNYSEYLACFTHWNGVKMTAKHTYTFPEVSVGDNQGKVLMKLTSNDTEYEAELKKQRFKSDIYGSRRASDGRLRLLKDINTLGIRFDASGNNQDDWYVNDVYAEIEPVDEWGPSTKPRGDMSVSEGPYYYGSYVTISIPFNEIVKVTGTPTLKTNWGNFQYVTGDGTNVLSFAGSISTGNKTVLGLESFSGTITDLKGNSFSGIQNLYDYILTGYSAQGYTIDMFTNIGENTYAIENKTDLKRLSSYVNGGESCEGLTFRQTADITDIGSFTPIGNSTNSNDQKRFNGTYDGGGYLLSGISVSKDNDYIGLFGYLDEKAIVENVHLASSSFEGRFAVGSIAGKSDARKGTIRNCRVESTVSVSCKKYNDNYFRYVGGIVGYSEYGNVEGCYSAAKISSVTNGRDFGGIVGLDYGVVKNCLFAGASFTVGNNLNENPNYGAIVGNAKNPEYVTNNYSTTANFKTRGDLTYGDWPGSRFARRISAGTGVTVTPAATATEYNVSGITAYGTTAISYDNKLYSGTDQKVDLTLNHGDREGCTFVGYSSNTGTLSGTENPYTLTVADGNATINTKWTLPISFADAGYATYYDSKFDAVLPAGVTAKIVTAEAGGQLTYETIADGDAAMTTVPAGTAVMLQCSANSANLTQDGTDIDSRSFDASLLHGSDVEATTTGGASYYKLTYGTAIGHQSLFGWYWGAANGVAFTSGAHKAWLALPATSAPTFIGLPDSETTSLTLMEEVRGQMEDEWCDLQGRKLEKKPSQKGLYIMNGRKVVVK